MLVADHTLKHLCKMMHSSRDSLCKFLIKHIVHFLIQKEMRNLYFESNRLILMRKIMQDKNRGYFR